MYKEIAKTYKGKTTDKELIRAYGQGQKDEVIAVVYCKYSRVFNTVCKKYVTINEEEKESIIMTKIWEALEYLQENELTSKLSTVIGQFISIELRNTLNASKYNKRIANEMSISENDLTDFDKDTVMAFGEVDDISMVEMVSFLDSKDLTENQRKFCDMALSGEVALKSGTIAAAIGISRAGAKRIVDSLRKICVELVY